MNFPLACPVDSVLIDNECLPYRFPDEPCTSSEQCLSYHHETFYSCIDNTCQTLSNQIVAKDAVRRSKKARKMPSYSWTNGLSSISGPSRADLVCPGRNSKPEIRNGIFVDCMNKKCGPNYKCEYIPSSVGGRYLCCSKRENVKSNPLMKALGMPVISAQTNGIGFGVSSNSLYSGRLKKEWYRKKAKNHDFHFLIFLKTLIFFGKFEIL